MEIKWVEQNLVWQANVDDVTAMVEMGQDGVGDVFAGGWFWSWAVFADEDVTLAVGVADDRETAQAAAEAVVRVFA